jgi:hypothetical protein
MEMTMPMMNKIIMARTPIVAPLNVLSPLMPFRTLNISSYLRLEFYFTGGI